MKSLKPYLFCNSHLKFNSPLREQHLWTLCVESIEAIPEIGGLLRSFLAIKDALYRNQERRLLCLLAVAVLSVCNVSAQGKRQISNRNIKSILIRWEDSRKDSTGTKSEFTRYDKKGNPIEVVERGENDSFSKWVKHTYNKRGDKTSSTYLDSAGNVIRKSISEYDLRGNEVYSARIDAAGNTTKKVTTSYDKWGKEIEKTTFDSSGEVTERLVTAYDNFNKKLSEISLDKQGKVIRKSTYDYDSKGMVKSKNIYDADGNLIYKREYTYEY